MSDPQEPLGGAEATPDPTLPDSDPSDSGNSSGANPSLDEAVE